MGDLTLRNLLIYCLVGAAEALAVCLAAAFGAGSVPLFREGEFFAPISGGVIAGLAVAIPALGTWLAANRPKLGREGISTLVGEIGALDASVILSAWRDRRQVPSLAPEELDRIADHMYERIAAKLTDAAPRPEAP